jgi:hypothetical protein
MTSSVRCQLTNFQSVLPIALTLLSIWLRGSRELAYGAETKSVQIMVDQVGFLPDRAKIAMITASAKTFEVKRGSDNATVFKGELAPPSRIVILVIPSGLRIFPN